MYNRELLVIRNCLFFSCAPDFYNFPTCEACLCNPAGALPVPGFPLGGCGSFDDGKTLCECKANVEGHICDQCKAGYYELTKDNVDGCKRKCILSPSFLLTFNLTCKPRHPVVEVNSLLASSSCCSY